MNNYKIVENRPELTSLQVLGGMNFAIVKAGAAATTTTIAGIVISKGVIIKGFITVIALLSLVIVYTVNNEGKDSEENETFVKNNLQKTNGQNSEPAITKETGQVTSEVIKKDKNQSVKPLMPEKPVGKPKESKEEVTSNTAVPSLTSPTTVMQMVTLPTIALTNPGPAVCQPHPNKGANVPISAPVKDSIK